jgi:hypothetical protein
MSVKQQLAVLENRTLFPNTVQDAPQKPTKNKANTKLRALKWAGGNMKIGGRMEKGRCKGMVIYSLTLQERSTCPGSCELLKLCYGDAMPFAPRYNVNDALYEALTFDVAALAKKNPQGFLVRLHVLGDFPTVQYVNFWSDLVATTPELNIYGYTHREHGTAIGDAIAAMVARFDRVTILRSNKKAADDPLPGAHVIPSDATVAYPGSVICPEERGLTESCGTCGLCMNGRTNISFLDHSVEARNRNKGGR